MRYVLLFAISAAAAIAQPVSFGIKAGVPLTDLLDAESYNPGILFSQYTSMTSPYIVGPTVEVGLPFGLAIEADALFRHLNYTDSFVSCFLCGASSSLRLHRKHPGHRCRPCRFEWRYDVWKPVEPA